MTDRQTQMAIKILQYLVDHNNYQRDGNVQVYACDGNTEDIDLEQEYLHVRGSLEKGYGLIRKDNADLHLTPDGESAHRIGFEKYLKKIKKGKQLEITKKELDVLGKFLSIFKDSKTVAIIVVGLLDALISMAANSVFPLIKGVIEWLYEIIATQ